MLAERRDVQLRSESTGYHEAVRGGARGVHGGFEAGCGDRRLLFEYNH